MMEFIAEKNYAGESWYFCGGKDKVFCVLSEELLTYASALDGNELNSLPIKIVWTGEDDGVKYETNDEVILLPGWV